jgi:hypothetical protein
MKEYEGSELAKDMPLEFADNPLRYELRFLEDDEDEYYLPVYDIPALDRTKTLCDINVSSIAFCKAKKYKMSSESESSMSKTGKLEYNKVEENKLLTIRKVAQEKGVSYLLHL